MKHCIYLIASLLCNTLTMHGAGDFDITLTPKWSVLDGNRTKATDFGGKWILVGSITFKKRSKDPIAIESITLQWNGDSIDNLIGSLYKKTPDKDFLPIEDNLVCDAVWNKKKQVIIFNFDERENLGPTTVFYLVLTVPEAIESLLKTGSFCLEKQCLPGPFKHCAQQEKLSLAINETCTKSAVPSPVN